MRPPVPAEMAEAAVPPALGVRAAPVLQAAPVLRAAWVLRAARVVRAAAVLVLPTRRTLAMEAAVLAAAVRAAVLAAPARSTAAWIWYRTPATIGR
jgi:hypothetical protein